jgi:DNA-directed RNA polymerase subunit RPC12/RpoP
MAKKKCGICGKELGFWDNKMSVKDGVICYDCFYKGNFYDGANGRRINKFIDTQTVTEMKELIDNPEKLQAVKRKVAPANHHHRKPIAQCAFCGQDIYKDDAPLKFKDSTYICLDCEAKHNATKAHNWASEHTLEDFKKAVKQDINFNNIYFKKQQQRQKEEEQENAKKQAEEEQRKQEIAAFKKKSVKYSHYYFNRTERKIYIGETFLDPDRFVDADEITSYRVAEKGHDKNKHHVFTRAAVGAIIAGPAGAVIAGTTGGKINEYIDHLGLIINLADGSSFEVKFLTLESKANSFYAKSAYSDLNHVISILDGWKATEKVVEDTQDSTDAPAEIRKYKQLLDDGIITKEEFEAKKKQLLGL